MKKLLLFTLLVFSVHLLQAQRQAEYLDRSPVAIHKGDNQLFISWRLLATDPDGITFNIYRQQGTSAPTRLNNEPIAGSTNFMWTAGSLSEASRIFILPVINGIEGQEEGSWELQANPPVHRIIRDFNFAPIPGTTAKYAMKFCWPADLDGDGRYDYILDRQNYGASGESEEEVSDINYVNPYVEAYTHNGEFKWRVDMGPNIKICSGMNDMVTAYDMDGDGKAEVLMKTSEGTTFSDGNVITGSNGLVTDYRTLNRPAPHFISIVNGETGIETDRIEMPNKVLLEKNDLYGEWNYKQLNGNFAIAYLDGIHPSLIFEQANRNSDKSFNHAVTAWDYREGKLILRWNWMEQAESHARFHQIRVADVDGDGFDEMIEGSWVMDHDGTPLFNTDLVHGDRHRTTDIDPDIPGLETFAIQQDNPNTLGMALYNAATGEMIKRWYQGAVGDVGRGECIDMDDRSRGLEMYSTMNGYYDCKGNMLADKATLQPAEGIWWDGDLLREVLSPIGKEGFNLAINKWNSVAKSFERELPNLYNEKSSYYTKAEWGGRPAFFGDIAGDWREELIVMRRDTSGFCLISNWAPTDKRLYCLMQNPTYRMQTTTKGYYQSPYTDYYLAHDMPAPPIPPVQKADIYFTSGNMLSGASIDGKSVMLDLRNPAGTIFIDGITSPKRLWVINPKGKDYEINGAGKFDGTMDLIKSQQGTLTLNGHHTYTGDTRISEGKIILNGSVTGKTVIDARGIISGQAELKGGIQLNEGLNYAGGRIEPGNGCEASALGTILIHGDVNGAGRNCFAFDIVPESAKLNDSIIILGNFNVTGNENTLELTFPENTPVPGIYTLLTFTGTSNAAPGNFRIRGLAGTPYELTVADHAITLEIKSSRAAQAVKWTGSESSQWNFSTLNFKAGDEAVFFVPGDEITFTDEAVRKAIQIDEFMPAAGTHFIHNTDYTLSGSGGISGAGELKKEGSGKLKINNSNSYTGSTILLGGVTEAASLGNAGEASSLGAGTNLSLSGATLSLSGINASDRQVTMTGNSTLDLNGNSSSLMLSGGISGAEADFVKTGAGLLNLQAAGTFKSVTLKQGIIFLGSVTGNRYGLSNTTVTMEGGSIRLFDINSTSSTYDSPFNMHVPEGAIAGLEGSSRWRMSGKLTGKGTLNFIIPYVRLDLNGDWSGFEGTINISTSRSAGADFRVGNDYGYRNATLNIGANISMYHLSSGKTIRIGGLSGSENSYLTGDNTTWQTGGNNASGMTFNGIISGSGSKLIKEGSGTLTLTGSNTYTGTTTVNGGILLAGNTAGSATGTGSVTVNSASIGGTGTFGGSVSISSGGKIEPGNASTSVSGLGTLTLGKNLTMNGTIRMGVRNAAGYMSDQLIVLGSTAVNGNLMVESINGTTPFPLGAEIKLFTFIGTVSGQFTTVTLPETEEGTTWNTDSLLTTGKVKVVVATAIRQPEEKGFRIYPNPARTNITFDLPSGEMYKMEITEISGKTVYSDWIYTGESIPVNTLEAGFYIIRIYQKESPVMLRLIKE